MQVEKDSESRAYYDLKDYRIEEESFQLTLRLLLVTDEEDERQRLAKLRDQRNHVHQRITAVADEISRGLKMAGSRTNLTMLVFRAEDLLHKSRKLTDRICMFQNRLDTASEFEKQLHYQRSVEDVKRRGAHALSPVVIDILFFFFF